MRYEAEWVHAGRDMVVGDVIMQRALMPPIGFGMALEFAVRVTEVFNEESRRGFAYETLTGHVERGVSRFSFEEKAGQIHFVIQTFSEPGHWTARLAGRWFTLPYQAWCTRRALENVRRLFLAGNPAARPAAAEARR